MKPIEFKVERTVRAPIEDVFARLIDIDGHNAWMADTGSMLKQTRQTRPGPPAVGTTFVDETSQGSMPGRDPSSWRRHTRSLPLVGEVEVGQAQVRGLAELPPAVLRRGRDAGSTPRKACV